LSLIPTAYSAAGLHVGLGFPYVTQYGLNLTMGQKWTLNAQYNLLDLSGGDTEIKLSMPEIGIQWHPFSGVFFLGLGVGQQSLDVSATDTDTGESASASVTSATTIAKVGWIWGRANEGFWFGMDIAFISPSSSDVEIETSDSLLTTSQEYKDVEEAGEAFGSTSYANFTFARFGYLF
jgi:hypothetical protein